MNIVGGIAVVSAMVSVTASFILGAKVGKMRDWRPRVLVPLSTAVVVSALLTALLVGHEFIQSIMVIVAIDALLGVIGFVSRKVDPDLQS